MKMKNLNRFKSKFLKFQNETTKILQPPAFNTLRSASMVLARRKVVVRGILAILAGGLFVAGNSASAALTFGRGTGTAVGPVRFSSSPDSVIITGALTGPGTVTSALAIPANRIQYDV